MSWRLPLGIMAGRGGAVVDTSVGALSPDAVSGLALWLKADAITGLSATDPVTTWSDSSGNGLDATGAGATRPTYQTAVVNGLPMVRYGIDDILSTASTSLGASGALTVFVVAYNIATAADRILLEHGANIANTDGSWLVSRESASSTSRAMMNHSNTLATMESANVGATTIGLTTTARLLTARFDRSLGQQETTIWVNGIYGGGHEGTVLGRTDNNLAGTFPLTAALNIGNRAGSGTLGANGDIGEVIVYTRALTSRERARIAMHLHKKWDLVN